MATEWVEEPDDHDRGRWFRSGDKSIKLYAHGSAWWQITRGDAGTIQASGFAPTREEAEARIALVLPLLDAAHTAIKAALWERDIAAKALGMATEVAS